MSEENNDVAENAAKMGKLKIDDKEYDLASLSDAAKAQIKNLQIAENEIRRLNAMVAMAQTARNAYMQALKSQLPSE